MLRGLRENHGMTQAQVAEALEWSLSKVSRIEGGDVTISKNDLTALLRFYDVHDADLVGSLVDDVRTARRRGWWAEPRLKEHLTPATLQLLQFEAEATIFRSFQPTLIPGLFQTEDYAAAIFHLWSDDLPEATRSARIEIRSRRREHVFGRPNPPQYLLILDESVLSRQIGGPRVMSGQLQELLRAAQSGHLVVRILPLAEPGMAALVGPFILIDLGADNEVLYWEAQFRDEIVQTADDVARHRRIFEQMWQNALDEQASTDLINARSATMIASLSRKPRPS
jgi:transcriptional regulator with XRE-family HTH domain